MKKSGKLLIALLVAVLFVSAAFSASASFPDVKVNDEYSAAVNMMQKLEVVQGDETGKFNPQNSITRAEFVKMLYVVLNGTTDVEKYTGVSSFVDVAESDWYCPYVNWAKAMGIATGYGNGYFGPNDSVTIAQVLKMLTIAVTGNSSLSYPYGYVLKAEEEGLLASVIENLTNVSAEARRDETCQLMLNILNKDCAFLGGAKPIEQFDVGSTAVDGKQVILIGSPFDTNNGAGLTGITKNNQYAFATIANGEFDHIATFEYDGTVSIPVGAPVILYYEKGEADGWWNAKSLLEVSAGYTDFVTAKANNFVAKYDETASTVVTFEDDTQGFASVTYTLLGKPYVVEPDFVYSDHFATKTADGSVRAGHSYFYYIGNELYSGKYDWDLSQYTNTNRTARVYRTEDRGAGLGASGLAELGRLLTLDEFTFYDTDGDGAYEFIWANPAYTCMEVVVADENRVVLGECVGNSEYTSGVEVARSQIRGVNVKVGDYVNVTVKTGIDGKPVYTATLANSVTGQFTGGAVNGNGQATNVVIGGKTYSFSYCNTQHGTEEYKQLYTRFGPLTARNVGKTYKIVLAPNGGIGHVIEVTEGGAPVEEEIKYGALNIGKVISLEPEIVKGVWNDTLVYNITIEDVNGNRTTYRAAADMRTVVNATYETIDNLSVYGNAWFASNSTYNVVLRYDATANEYVAAINGTYVHYELNKNNEVTLLMAASDIINGYDTPTNALVNGYAYAVVSDKFDWSTYNTAFKGETAGYIFKDANALIFVKTASGVALKKLADVRDFNGYRATIVTLNGKAVLISMDEIIEEDVVISTDHTYTTLFGYLKSFYYQDNADATYGEIFITYKELLGAEKTVKVQDVTKNNYRALVSEFEEIFNYRLTENDLLRIYINENGEYATYEYASYGNGEYQDVLNYGAITDSIGNFYLLNNVVDIDANGKFLLSSSALCAKLSDNVKVYVIKGDADMYLADGITGSFIEVPESQIKLGTAADPYVMTDGAFKPVFYNFTYDESGIACIENVFVLDRLCNFGETVSVSAQLVSEVNAGSSYYDDVLGKVVFPYGEELSKSHFTSAFILRFETVVGGVAGSGHVFDYTLDLIDSTPGTHTVKAYATFDGVKYETTLTYTVEGETVIPSGEEFEIVIDTLPIKTVYSWDGTSYGEPTIDGIVLRKVSASGDVVLSENQYSLITTSIAIDTDHIVVRAFGKDVIVPVTVELPTITNVWMVSTPNHSVRTYAGAVRYAYYPSTTFGATANSNSLIAMYNNGWGAGNAIATAVIDTTVNQNTRTKLDATVYKLADSVDRAAVDELFGLPVVLTINPETNEVIGAELLGTKITVTSDRVDALSNGGSSKYYLDGEELGSAVNGRGRRWTMNYSSGGYLEVMYFQTKTGFNSGAYTSVDADVVNPRYELNKQAPDIVTFVDTNGDGRYDWTFCKPITKGTIDHLSGTAIYCTSNTEGGVINGSYTGNNYTLTGAGGSAWLGLTNGTVKHYSLNGALDAGLEAGKSYYIELDWTSYYSGFNALRANLIEVGNAVSDLRVKINGAYANADAIVADPSGLTAYVTVYGKAEAIATITNVTKINDYKVKVRATYLGEVLETEVDVEVPTGAATILQAPEKTAYKNGEAIDLTGISVQVELFNLEPITVGADKLTAAVSLADIANPQITLVYNGVTLSAAVDITVSRNVTNYIIAATWADNVRNGSTTASLATAADKLAVFENGAAISAASVKQLTLADALVGTLAVGKGVVAEVEIGSDGKVCAVTPIGASVTYLGSELLFDTETNTLTVNGSVDLPIDADALVTNANKNIYMFYGTTMGTNTLAVTVNAEDDDRITLTDTDGDGLYDYVYSEAVLTGVINAIDKTAKTITLGCTFGSSSASGWFNTASRFMYEGDDSALAAGDLVNFTIRIDKTASIPFNSGANGNFPPVIQLLSKADSMTGEVTDVVVGTSNADITFKLNGVDMHWSDQWNTGTWGDGADGVNAGRTTFESGNVYTVYFDLAGNAVYAVAGSEAVVYVSAVSGGTVTINGTAYTNNAGITEVGYYNVVIAEDAVVSATGLTETVVYVDSINYVSEQEISAVAGGTTYTWTAEAAANDGRALFNGSTLDWVGEGYYKLVLNGAGKIVYAVAAEETSIGYFNAELGVTSVAEGDTLTLSDVTSATVVWKDGTTTDVLAKVLFFGGTDTYVVDPVDIEWESIRVLCNICGNNLYADIPVTVS